MYIINITTKTAAGDLYKRVSVNLNPMIVFGNFDFLKESLASENIKDLIKKLLRTKALYDAGEYYIREVKENGDIIDNIYPIQELTDVSY